MKLIKHDQLKTLALNIVDHHTKQAAFSTQKFSKSTSFLKLTARFHFKAKSLAVICAVR